MNRSPDWYKDTTVYQIYPRSFQDSNGDGIGDIPGIISRLDELRNLGFETLWISPFFASPQKDFGYDISDYRSIAPEYGTMEDCRRLIDEVHLRGMKIIFDMVLNHTSDRHPWFIESASSKENPKRDWYVWKDGRRPGKAPNNWQSQVSGSGWHYNEATDQWYWAAFLPFQPDLNYRNPEVKEEMFSTLRFWLDKGVDGFRLDIIGAIYEDVEFRDNPLSRRLLPSEDSTDKLFRSTTRIENLPETIEFAKELRRVMEEYDERILIGETFGAMSHLRDFTGRDEPDGLHAAFLFKSLTVAFKTKALKKLIEDYERHFPEPWIPTWVFANHDSMRRISWFRGDQRKLKLQVLLQHSARGIPFTYQGEEIGLEQGRLSPKVALDPVAHLFDWLPDPLFRFLDRRLHGSLNRDGCRSPLPWNGSPHGGFCPDSIDPWLPFSASPSVRNVENQKADPNSLWRFNQAILELRKSEPALRRGTLFLDEVQQRRRILIFERQDEGSRLQILMNLSKQRRSAKGPETVELLLSTDQGVRQDGDVLILPPWSGAILRMEIH